MSRWIILVVILFIVLFGGGYGCRMGSWATYPQYGDGSSIVGLLIVVLLILLLLGRI